MWRVKNHSVVSILHFSHKKFAIAEDKKEKKNSHTQKRDLRGSFNRRMCTAISVLNIRNQRYTS